MRKSIQTSSLTDPVMGKERHADIPCLPVTFTLCFSPIFLFSFSSLSISAGNISYPLPLKSKMPLTTTRGREKRVHETSVDLCNLKKVEETFVELFN